MLPPIGSESSKKISVPNKPAPPAECPICGGLGWISADVPVDHPQFGKLLPCPHRQAETVSAVSQKLWDALGPLRHMTLENFLPEGHAATIEQRTSLRNAFEGVRRFIDEPRGWLFLQGGYGCGKTHLAAAIANALLSAGTPVVFVNMPKKPTINASPKCVMRPC
jgi:DNA replication protein DnaC